MPRIRWTIEEQQLIIQEAARSIIEKKVFSLREAFNTSQSKLPKHRFREIAALSQVPWFTDGVPCRVKELEAERHNSFEDKLAQAVEEARQTERQRLEDECAQTAGKFLAKAFCYALDDPDLKRKLFLYMPNPVNSGITAPKSRNEKRIRVVVAGLLNGQARTIEEKYSEQLDLRFWSKDQSHETLKQILAHADVAIGMVSFLPHSADGILKSAKIPYHPISGGVTHIKAALEKLV